MEYQGLSSQCLNQRQSAEKASTNHAGLPSPLYNAPPPIHCHHQVEALDDRCRVCEVLQPTAPVGHGKANPGQLLVAGPLLQTEQPHSGNFREGGKTGQRCRAPEIYLVGRVALPGDT